MAQRLAWVVVVAALVLGCGGKSSGADDQAPEPEPTLELPTAGIAGEPVAVYPVTLVTAAEELDWQPYLAIRREALDRADSIIGALLTERSPEVTWILPADLRRAAARAPGLLTNPDQMGTALLRAPGVERIPDPLRSQMRSLNGVAADRFSLVPTALIFTRTPDGRGQAELTLVMADVRTGLLPWRTVARGVGDDPWEALRVAFKTLTPGLP
ncbi:MAG: hypothetical protein OEY20_08210 [Gemmatimonadota bacterium]|nr:hypothetical protein [Gemmatimonadota bacterium]MDH4352256.1 hypothetical protein [Gemmatimonadota bacterium]MDH5197219.1 hypothetical protein [Gemmatimonadota bacterium]